MSEGDPNQRAVHEFARIFKNEHNPVSATCSTPDSSYP
jgi:hypothetical protein